MTMASNPLAAIGILGSSLWLAAIARARKRYFKLGLDHGLDEAANLLAQSSFNWIKPVVQEAERRLSFRLREPRLRAIIGHGVVSTGARTPDRLGFNHLETTPPSIPTKPRTAPWNSSVPSCLPMEREGSEGIARW